MCAFDRNQWQKDWRKKNPEKYKAMLRRNNLKRNYGLTEEAFNLLLDNQHGVCAICGTSEPTGRGDSFHVDHCHRTNVVRGLLCHHCNLLLGNSKESIATLQAAINYLDSEVPVEKEK